MTDRSFGRGRSRKVYYICYILGAIEGMGRMRKEVWLQGTVLPDVPILLSPMHSYGGNPVHEKWKDHVKGWVWSQTWGVA